MFEIYHQNLGGAPMKEFEFGELPDLKHDSLPALEQGDWPDLNVGEFPKELIDELPEFEAVGTIEEQLASLVKMGMKPRYLKILTAPMPKHS